MQLLNGGFNANNFDPAQQGSQMPLGRYTVQVSGSEVKPTKDQTSGMVVLKCIIQDGPNAGVEAEHRFNVYHKDDVPRNIAERQLSAVCHVTGVMELQDTQQLHGAMYIVDVGMQKEPNPKGYTQVNKVFDINGNEPMKGRVGPQPGNGQQPQQQGSTGGFGNQQQTSGFGQQTQQTTQQQPQGQQFANNVPLPDANQGQQQAPQQQANTQQWGNQGQQQTTQQAPGQGQQQAPAWGQPTQGQGGSNAPAWGQNRQ